MLYTIEQVSHLIGARRFGTLDAQIDWLLTDSRSLVFPEGTLFFALSSKRQTGAWCRPGQCPRASRRYGGCKSCSPRYNRVENL